MPTRFAIIAGAALLLTATGFAPAAQKPTAGSVVVYKSPT
jgi:hypothetical protein